MALKQIGITGGIGSGKSTVCLIFQQLGYKIYNADDRSKWLLANNSGVIRAIKSLLGEKVYKTNGEPDRKKISELVFSTKDPQGQKNKNLKALNNILHPAVQADFEKWIKGIPKSYEKSFVIKEAALLFEAGTTKNLDAIIEVFAPLSLRLKRVMERDQVKEKDVLSRMEQQWPEWKKIFHSDYILFNDGTHPLIPQVLKAIQWLEKA